MSVTRRDGKGVPFGSSDSTQPFARLAGVSNNPQYGYTEAQPIGVRNGSANTGPRNESMFLNALRASQGQPIEYERMGSCCAYEQQGRMGLLDVFRITTPDSAKPVLLYLNMYADGEQLAPQGFTLRRQQ